MHRASPHSDELTDTLQRIGIDLNGYDPLAGVTPDHQALLQAAHPQEEQETL